MATGWTILVSDNKEVLECQSVDKDSKLNDCGGGVATYQSSDGGCDLLLQERPFGHVCTIATSSVIL